MGSSSAIHLPPDPVGRHYTGNFLSADGRFAARFISPSRTGAGGGRERQHGSYSFSSAILFPRGYSSFTGPDFHETFRNLRSAAFYRTWHSGQFAYLKRVAANVFYDYGKLAADCTAPPALKRFSISRASFSGSLRGGVRYAYRLDYHSTRVQPFIAYNW